ncbi:carbamoyltransferase HypF [Actinobacillus pleuropneumoniae]|uniref:carbamoyltransferase HypF n=1 Tax=Actinobacillus pleuropneumoniae TaxID=715 RepID=UPI00208E6ADC|nr:carbamoyltransferase HypF [Actinobacillus pleuropneumoniae]USQ15966.1 carbamoyltransferase HypF [Actinobacillus pleuropneumoniae]
MGNTAYNGIEIRVKGKVQGVGFRPFVWQLANEHHLYGDVNNDGQGVLIRILTESETKKLDAFLYDLQNKLPPLAQITSLQIQPTEWDSILDPNAFLIRESENSQMDTQVIPDAATCPACLNEIFDINNRRFHYPFTNCTHCGPRFTIIRSIPYDRHNTSMRDFAFCPVCKQEYKDPADRRFHAQPNACPECGPHIIFCDRTQRITQHYSAILEAVEKLRQGCIVAVKGLGGFHLACDATQAKTIDLLRRRKTRPSKPFAVMVPNLNWLTELTEEEKTQLQSSAAPIVLLAKHKTKQIHDAVAPQLNEIGVMLPSNPLQHLLMKEINKPLVMTSANQSGLPPVLDNDDAFSQLAGLADYWLLHNRDILQRADDSVIRIAFDGMETLRRARGYVPNETELQLTHSKNILALGADLKNTFCLLRGNHAVVTQHLGDMQNEQIQQQLMHNIALFEQIYQFKPDVIAVDAHQGYFTHQLGKKLAERYQVPYIEVLHHHAHIMSVLAEHHRVGETVIGLALDGIGMGENHQLWGGECLLVTKDKMQYLGGLPAVALAGGDTAAKQPWRNLLAHCLAFVPNWQDYKATQFIQTQNWQPLAKAIANQLNSPLISSAGRLFDAAACALGIASECLTWEGEAACQLETIAWQYEKARVEKSAVENRDIFMPLQQDGTLDLAYFWQQWLPLNILITEKAWIFHRALAQGLADLARKQAQQYQVKTIVLSGGVWHNQLLRTLIRQELTEFEILTAHQFPQGDGGIALGQAVLAGFAATR